MANTMRWRYGDTNPVMLPVSGGTVIEIGDLVYLDTSEAKPAADQADQGSHLLNQGALQDAFVGVAMQSSPSGETEPIRIATTGVFEFECETAAAELGDLLGSAENDSLDGLRNQKVAAAPAESSALGRCAKQKAAGATRVLIDVISTVLKGGVQEAA